MMGKATSTRVERAIWRTGAGRYEVRVVNKKGSQKRAKITVDTLAEALAMREVAEQARKEGGSARVAWASMRGIDGTRVRRVKIDEMFKRYLEHGDKLVSQGGDHKDPAPRSGSAEIRRATTQRGYRRNVKLVKRLIAEVGVGYADEMTADKLEEVRNEMADRGLAKNTQQSRLFHVCKALEHLDAGEQPEGFPNDHKKVKPLKPGKPRKRAPNPAKWGGTYGDDPPALPLHEAFDIAEEMGPERGLAVYLMVLMGLRRGEALGVTLEKISHEGGRLYITIEDQRFEKKIEEQAKTTASYRKLPVPEVMKAALVGYCRGLHGWDPTGDQNPPDPSSPLVLSPTRTIELPGQWGKAFRDARQACRLDYDDLGYELTPHHLRKSCSAQILAAQQTAGKVSAWPKDDLDALGVTKDSLLQLGMQVPQVNASIWLGHETKGTAGAPYQASAITLNVYNPTLTALEAEEATADWLTFAARLDKWVAYNKTMLFVAVATLMGNPPAGDRLSEGSVKPVRRWTLPVPQFDEFLLDGEDGWRSYRLYAQEHGLDVAQFANLTQPRNWLHNALGGPPETVDVWTHRTRDGAGRPVVDEGADPRQTGKPRAAWRVADLDMVRTYLESAATADVLERLGLCQGPKQKSKSEYTNGHLMLERLINGGFIEALPAPYSTPYRRFDRGEVERAYEALVVAPILEVLAQESGGRTPEAIGVRCEDEPILMSPQTGRPARPATRKAQVKRCLQALEKDRLVKKARNGTWSLTDTGLEAHARLTGQAGE